MKMRNLGIIGFGNMGAGIAEKLKNDYQLFVFDKDKTKTSALSGINAAASIGGLLDNSEIIILAVKPQDMENILGEIKAKAKDKLVISIAAGISTGFIEKILGAARVIRAMPNLAAKIGEGMTCLAKGRFVGSDDLDLAKNLFGRLGETLVIDEKMINAATAISGSGPGYLYDFIGKKKISDKAILGFEKQLIKAGQTLSFNQREAYILAHTTVKGSLALLKFTGLTALELKKQVASKGGTTEAGLEVLDKGGSLEEAAKAALKRANELSKG